MRAIYLSSQGIGAAGAYQLVRHQSLRRFFFTRKTVFLVFLVGLPQEKNKHPCTFLKHICSFELSLHAVVR